MNCIFSFYILFIHIHFTYMFKKLLIYWYRTRPCAHKSTQMLINWTNFSLFFFLMSVNLLVKPRNSPFLWTLVWRDFLIQCLASIWKGKSDKSDYLYTLILYGIIHVHYRYSFARFQKFHGLLLFFLNSSVFLAIDSTFELIKLNIFN